MNWVPVQRMISSFVPVSALEAERLQDVLNESGQFLHPFKDPLLIDFGAHRWLSSAREESYSDWLAWILTQLQSPKLVFSVLLEKYDANLQQRCKQRLTVHRELGLVDEDGFRRRTDLELMYGREKAILVEVKKGDASHIDLEQLRVQLRHKPGFGHYVLLAGHGEHRQYADGFQLRTWNEVCVALRRIVAIPELKGTVEGAMILAFVGAVEQNLLGYPGNFSERFARGELISVSLRQRIEAHLKSAING